MTKQLSIVIIVACFACACSNKPGKTDSQSTVKDSFPGNANASSNTGSSTDVNSISETGPKISFSADGKEMTMRNTILVSKDDKKVSPGNDYIATMIANSHDSNKISLTLNFVFALQPGTYPIVGYGFQRNVNGKGEMFGGLLGGGTKISPYKITLTSCEKIREHHWKIAGTVDEIAIPINGLMKLDMKVKHPDEIKLTKISFANMEFDDNLDELMEKAMKKP